MTDALPKDLDKIRDDPTANPALRELALSLKNSASFELPDWKKEALAPRPNAP
jgi:hypothetical protein